MPTLFTKRSAPISFDKDLGLCFGWFCFNKKDGEDYVDAHGDHFPGDELLKAVDSLMAKPASDREINVEHVGAGRGVIATAQYLGEDIAKAMGIDTGGNYGVIGSFRPDAALLKSISAGDMFCLSIEGMAHDVEQVAKSAGADVAATAHKRTMRKVELTKLAVVKLGAHEGAAVAIVKTAANLAARAAVARIAKFRHGLTAVSDGHQHIVYDIGDPDAQIGGTSYETSTSGGYGHSHSWIRGADGAISIVASAGHTHDLITTVTELEKHMPTALEISQAAGLLAASGQIAKLQTRVIVASGLTAEQAEFAKRLKGADLESFLDASDADRAARSKPIHKSERTGRLFFLGEEALVEFAKDADVTHAKLAKAEKASEEATIAKSVAAVPYVKGAALLVRAAYLLPDADRDAALADLATVNATVASITKNIGSGGGGGGDGDAWAVYSAELAEFAKTVNKSPDDAAPEFLATAKGKAANAAYDAASKPAR